MTPAAYCLFNTFLKQFQLVPGRIGTPGDLAPLHVAQALKTGRELLQARVHAQEVAQNPSPAHVS